MATTVQFKAYISQFVRNEYLDRSDAHKLNEAELNEVLQYKNISENFEYNDLYGSSRNIKATLVSVEKTKYSDLIFTIEINKSIPKHYAPSISQILKGKGLLFPISYQCL